MSKAPGDIDRYKAAMAGRLFFPRINISWNNIRETMLKKPACRTAWHLPRLWYLCKAKDILMRMQMQGRALKKGASRKNTHSIWIKDKYDRRQPERSLAESDISVHILMKT